MSIDLDLAYRSVVRLKRLLELDAPGIIVKKEMCFMIEVLLHKYDDPAGFASRCVDAADRRDIFNDEPIDSEIEK